MNAMKQELAQGAAHDVKRSHLISRRVFRRSLLVIVVFVAAGLGQGERVDAEPCWAPPVDGVVTDPFRKPDCPWCQGNRGIEYRVARVTAARAAATGRVTFSGRVVGTLYVVVQVANGWRLTYGKLDSTHVERGDIVVAGSVIGQVSGNFFFGVRDGGEYVDPAPFLGRTVGPPRLIPYDGTAARPLTTSRLRCQPRSGAR